MSKVYLVGAGPGTPDLMTLKSLELIRKAGCHFDTVIMDIGSQVRCGFGAIALS